MGRDKKSIEKKKVTISIVLDLSVFNEFESLNVKKKSQLINNLLKEHLSVESNLSL